MWPTLHDATLPWLPQIGFAFDISAWLTLLHEPMVVLSLTTHLNIGCVNTHSQQVMTHSG